MKFLFICMQKSYCKVLSYLNQTINVNIYENFSEYVYLYN